MPLSGAAGGHFAGDVLVPRLGRVEVKARHDGFKQLYGWLDGADALALKADRRPWLLVLPLDRAMELLGADLWEINAEYLRLPRRRVS